MTRTHFPAPTGYSCDGLAPADPWFRFWRDGFGFPDNYVTLHLVTSGLRPEDDLILEAAACLVRDRVVEARVSVLLDWSQEPGFDPGWLEGRLAETAAAMNRGAGHGRSRYPWEVGILAASGLEPRQGLGLLLAAVRDAQGRGWPVVAHNGWKFVVPFLREQARDWLGQNWDAAGDNLVDVGLMEKARLAGVVPHAGERREGFWARARHAYGSGWSLQDDCVPRYDLAGRPGLEPDQAHRAAFGAHAVHLLLEEFRRLGDAGT